MTFDAVETSIEQAAPIELFEFRMGGEAWFFTNVEEDVNSEAKTYRSVVITRDDLSVKQEIQKAGLTINVLRDNPVAQLFIADNPSQLISLTLKRLHRTDTDDQVQVMWKGRVLQAKFDGLEAEMVCEPIFTSLQRPGLRRSYQTLCSHVLYDDNCGVIAGSFRDRAKIAGVNGRQIQSSTFAEKPDGYYAAGRVETLNGVREMVSEHVGDTVTLLSRLQGAEVGDTIDVFPGCDHKMTTCRDKFNNLENNGSFPYVPGQSPFGGNPVM